MLLQPYLFFEGRCEEALAFYRQALGAEVTMLMRYMDSPVASGCEMPPGSAERVMHCNVQVGATQFMASDGRCSGALNFQGFALSLSPTDGAEAERLFNALADGGQVHMPLGETFWSPRFGMVADRFGVLWMINTLPAA